MINWGYLYMHKYKSRVQKCKLNYTVYNLIENRENGRKIIMIKTVKAVS